MTLILQLLKHHFLTTVSSHYLKIHLTPYPQCPHLRLPLTLLFRIQSHHRLHHQPPTNHLFNIILFATIHHHLLLFQIHYHQPSTKHLFNFHAYNPIRLFPVNLYNQQPPLQLLQLSINKTLSRPNHRSINHHLLIAILSSPNHHLINHLLFSVNHYNIFVTQLYPLLSPTIL